MKLRCLLVDDEPPALKVLQSHIANVKGMEIVGLCKNAVEALDILHTKTVDLMFLDIKMPKILGTDFLSGLSNPPKVIFVTAYRGYAVRGYELDAIDYLVKPVSFERFLKSVSKIKRIMGVDTPSLSKEYHTNPEAFIYLKVEKNMRKLFVQDILYIESWKDYVKVFLDKGSELLVRQSISSIENLLSEHKFLRIHRSYIISLNKLSSYNQLAIQLGSKELPIGRLYKQQVMEVLKVREK